MRKIVDFFRLIRIQNLLIVTLTQFFAYYFLNKNLNLIDIINPNFLYLVMATVLVAAAGYIINDYMDVKLDLVNKPNKVIIGQSISRRWAMFLHLSLTFFAIIFSLKISIKVLILIIACTFMLWLYSQFLKKTYLAGNLLVSILTAFTIFILWFFNNQINLYGIITYSVFAFLTTLLREIVKDTEDLRGDEKFKAKTLPIVVGVRKAKNVILALQAIILVFTLLLASWFGALSNANYQTNFLFITYTLFLVCMPMLINIWLIKTADIKNDFSRLSLLIKLNMLLGIFSMCFWRF